MSNNTNSTREEQAAKIMMAPEKYKICRGCDSIVANSAKICPACHSYRFNNSLNEIIDHAETLASREQTTVKPEDLY